MSNKCSTSLVMAINALAKRSCSTKLSSSERLSRTAASSSTWRDASRRSFSNGCRAQSAVSEVFTFESFRFVWRAARSAVRPIRERDQNYTEDRNAVKDYFASVAIFS